MSNRISRFMWPFFGAALLLAVILAGCTGSPSQPAPVTTMATPAPASPPPAPVATTAGMVPVPQTTAPPATAMPTVPATTGGTPAPVSVTIQDFAFHPASVTVPAGTTVTWTNLDAATHSIVSDAGKFSSSNLPTRQSFSFTFTDAGSYPYHCGIHTTMHGTVIVT